MANAKKLAYPSRPIEESARLGKEIYNRDILHLVEADHDGEFVSIDIDSGIWAVADTLLKATRGLREKNPDAVDVWTERVGYVAAGSIGGGAPPRRKK